jgi:integral membrane protein (TIGR00529 family)
MSTNHEIFLFVSAAPAILKVLVVFVAAVILGRFRIHLGISLTIGGIALNFWAGLAPMDVAANLIKSFSNLGIWLFVLIMFLVLEIGRYFTDEENSNEIVAAVRRWSGRHGATWVLVSLPAIIGLMPMPGGAILSAPFVQQTGSRVNGSPEWKTAVNYWFRHVWEYWWPLYPGVIVAMVLFKMIPLWKFALAQSVFTVVAIGAGYFFLIRSHVSRLAEIKTETGGSSRRAVFLFLPLAVVVISAMCLPSAFIRLIPFEDKHTAQIVKMLAMLTGLVIAVAIIVLDDIRAGKKKTRPVMFEWKSLSIEMSLVGTLAFSGMLESSGLLPQASRELAASGIPLVIIVAVLPFVAALVMGLAVGFVGTSFPIIVSLMTASGSDMNPVATLALAYGFGYMGMMMSPVHLCLLATRDYFASNLLAVYKLLTPCLISVFVFAVMYYAGLRLMGW